METIGFIGPGKIGLPICANLIKSGYRVLGYRRGTLAEFEKIGGVAGGSPADIAAQLRRNDKHVRPQPLYPVQDFQSPFRCVVDRGDDPADSQRRAQ